MAREPITIVQIDQDFCEREFGIGECRAGCVNYIPNNTEYNGAAWEFDSWTVANISNICRFTKQSGGTTNRITLVNGLSYISGRDVYFSGTVEDSDSNIDQFKLYVETVSGESTAVVNTGNGDFTQSGFDSFSVVESSASGYFRFEGRINSANIPAAGALSFEFLHSGAVPPVTRQASLYGFQAATKPNQSPIFTSGAPFISSPTQCFNTRATCADIARYSLGDPLELKFVSDRSPQMRDAYYLPLLKSVRIGPAKLNPGGASGSMSALGTRATLSATFIDRPHTDRLVDPYVDDRDYDPLERSSFWPKWRARNPYYLHRPITFTSGYYVDGELVDAVVRKFVITDFTGPDSDGKVTINGKDILTLAEGGKAQAPAQSTGKLLAGISNVAGSATLSPTGVGDLEYPASGYIRIGKEVMAFTRSADALTLTTRGAYGTADDVDAHDADANVQLCLRYDSESPHDILEDLLVNYAGIPAGYLDTSQWEEEAVTNGFLPYLYSALITSPESVSKLIGELCEQMYFAVWYDERDAKVKIRALRFAQGEEITDLNDNAHLLKDSVTWSDRPDEQLTQIWVYYGQINPTEKLDEEKNYAAVEVVADLDAESAERYSTKKIKKIFSRWIGTGNAAAAVELAQTMHQMFGNIPREIGFALDAKDRALWLGDFVRINNRMNVNQFGLPLPANAQIFQAEEVETGSKYRYVAQEFIPASVTTPEDGEINVIISADTLNVDLRELYDATIAITPVSGDIIIFTIREGVTIGGDTAGGGVNVQAATRVTSNDFYDAGNHLTTSVAVGLLPILQRQSISAYRDFDAGDVYAGTEACLHGVQEWPVSRALRTGTWPSGVILRLIVEAGARILGEGGNGAAHLRYSEGGTAATGIPAGDGGHALLVEHEISINNLGIIAGGGGGGSLATAVTYSATAPGGGGAGFAQSRTSIVRPDSIFSKPHTPATGGTTDIAGSGAILSASNPRYNSYYLATSMQRGNGGGLAQNGDSASAAILYPNASLYDLKLFNNYGLAGHAIADGSELITWIAKGDVRGAEN